MNKQLFCLVGLPLSGKSYVGKLLAASFQSSTYIATGDIARSLIKSADEQKQMEATDLYPGGDALCTELKRLVDASTQDCIIVDGFPRSPDQAAFLSKEFFHLFPTIVEVTTADLTTLAIRAKQRARDSRDTDPAQFAARLNLAIRNQNSVSTVLNSLLLPHYTIVSTASRDSILEQFKYILKDTK